MSAQHSCPPCFGQRESRGGCAAVLKNPNQARALRRFYFYDAVHVKKILKFLIGLLLLPLCWSFSRTIFILLCSVPGGSGWMEWALPVGFLMSALGFFLLPRAFRTYVLGHELTHAFWGMLFGAKIGKMKVGKEGGHVMLSKSNFLISLAPYFFPFYTAAVIALWVGLGLFFDLSAYEPWWLAAIGLTWGFHVTFTVYMLSQRQPDVAEHGRVFSYVLIYLANLFFVALGLIVPGTVTFQSAVESLEVETVAAYSAVQSLIRIVWKAVSSIKTV